MKLEFDGLAKRQSSPFDNTQNAENPTGYHDGFWDTGIGFALRYILVGGLLLSILIFFFAGYQHAQYRLRRGLPLKGYHRWMIRKPNYVPSFAPQPETRYAFHREHGWVLDGLPPPPPAYNSSDAPPPTYQPPGATKAMASQTTNEVTANEAAPSPRSIAPGFQTSR